MKIIRLQQLIGWRKCLFFLLVSTVGLRGAAQVSIDSIGILKGKSVVIGASPLCNFNDTIVLFLHGRDAAIPDLSKANIYINGVRMLCYHVDSGCPACLAPVAEKGKGGFVKGDSSNAGQSATIKSAAARPGSPNFLFGRRRSKDSTGLPAEGVSQQADGTKQQADGARQPGDATKQAAEMAKTGAPPAAGGEPSSDACYTLSFVLNEDSVAIWDRWYGFSSSKITVLVDIGTDAKVLTCNLKQVLNVQVFPLPRVVIGILLVAAFLAYSIVTAFRNKGDMLRDISTANRKPFSLSRFQLFWWSLIVISCYILLYAIRDHFDLMNTTALILLGISVSTTGMASIIDIRDDDKDRHQNIEGVGFWTDIISDQNGLSIHRYQNVIFTFLFGLIFVYKVLQTGRMPDFDSSELILMGLSSTAYLALKAGENAGAKPKNDADAGTDAGVNAVKANPSAVG